MKKRLLEVAGLVLLCAFAGSYYSIHSPSVVQLDWHSTSVYWADYRDGDPPAIFDVKVVDECVIYVFSQGAYTQKGSMPVVTYKSWIKILSQTLSTSANWPEKGRPCLATLRATSPLQTWSITITKENEAEFTEIFRMMDGSFPGIERAHVKNVQMQNSRNTSAPKPGR